MPDRFVTTMTVGRALDVGAITVRLVSLDGYGATFRVGGHECRIPDGESRRVAGRVAIRCESRPRAEGRRARVEVEAPGRRVRRVPRGEGE